MRGVIDAAVARARPVLLVLALVLTAGSVAYVTIPKESETRYRDPHHLRADPA